MRKEPPSSRWLLFCPERELRAGPARVRYRWNGTGVSLWRPSPAVSARRLAGLVTHIDFPALDPLFEDAGADLSLDRPNRIADSPRASAGPLPADDQHGRLLFGELGNLAFESANPVRQVL